jgi:tetratricopeptide (TPR) repeat protein
MDAEGKSSNWRSEARGIVRVPVGLWLHLAIYIGTPRSENDLSSLQGLKADDLWSIDLCKQPVNSNDLRYIAGLTGLHALYLSKAHAIADRGIAYLAALTSLRQLDLYATGVTDNSLVHLSQMKALEELHLGDTRVGDEGLVHLRALDGLKDLNLHGTDITDAAIPVLEAMTQLRRLRVWDTTITLEGVRRLRSSLPACDVESGHLHALASAVQKKPDDAEAWHELGRALFQDGRSHRAIAPLREATRLRPGWALAWLSLYRALSREGSPEEARYAFRKAALAFRMTEEEFERVLNKDSREGTS